MQKVIFTGCSYTAGNGWADTEPAKSMTIECKDDPRLWVNLCNTRIDQLINLEIVNLGKGGASNFEIFVNTVGAIGNFGTEIDTLFCQWTSMPRYNFDVGFELWPTREGLAPEGIDRVKLTHDVNLNRGDSWTRKYLDDLLDRFLVLHHLHGEIVKVVEYTNILKNLCKKIGIKLYFINGICPWDQNYFVKLAKALPEEYTPFTKKEILNIKSRDDKDIFKLYNIMHDNYDQVGGIDPTTWINLYDSMHNNKIDKNYDNVHPGIQSNQLYFQQVKNFLENQ